MSAPNVSNGEIAQATTRWLAAIIYIIGMIEIETSQFVGFVPHGDIIILAISKILPYNK